MQIRHIFLFNRALEQKKHLILWSKTKDVVLLPSDKKRYNKSNLKRYFGPKGIKIVLLHKIMCQ